MATSFPAWATRATGSSAPNDTKLAPLPIADLLVRNARLPDGRTDCDVLVTDGRIVEVAKDIAATAARSLDADGYLLSPPFVDAHFHMDSTLSFGQPRVNRSGTLLEGIALWGELKPLLTQDSLIERALTYCDWAVAKDCSRFVHMSTFAIRGCSPSRRCSTCAKR